MMNKIVAIGFLFLVMGVFEKCDTGYVVNVQKPMSSLWKIEQFDYNKRYSNFLGCYSIDETKTWIRSERISYLMTISACLDSCSNMEMTFSGVFNGTECFCTDKVPSMILDDLACNKICPGNIGFFCGGVNAGVVYQVCRPGRYGSRCGLPCFCLNYMPCNYITGKCYFAGCHMDYKGDRCAVSIKDSDESEGIDALLDRYPDWMSSRGNKIPLNCSTGRYGLYCKFACHCKSKQCHRVTGYCDDDCREGWMGGRCDKTDPCYNNPCLNGGTCTTFYPEAVCTCPKEFIGVRCQRADPCLSLPCKNGGKCEVVSDTMNCICEGDFTGIYCEINLSIFPSEPTYLGCATDGQPELREEHSLEVQILLDHSHDMDIHKCTFRCRAKLYTFAGLKDGDKCFCGNDYGRYGVHSDLLCNIKCIGNHSQACGGRTSFSVYTVCPIGKYKEDCMESCHCGGQQPCLLINGKCPYPLCSSGWEGPSCNIEGEDTEYNYKKAVFYYKVILVLFTGVCCLPTIYYVFTLYLL